MPQLQYLRKSMTIIQMTAISLLPFLMMVDFFGWLIPGLPFAANRGLSILPLFNIIFCVGIMVAAYREILRPYTQSMPFTVDAIFSERFGLSKREKEVLQLLLEFRSYREIGERLFISPGTARSHVVHIHQKVGVSSRLELARLFLSVRTAETSGLPKPELAAGPGSTMVHRRSLLSSSGTID